MNKKILLVEDDLDALNCYKNYLEKKGFPVVTATHGKRALDFFLNARPGCVIMDIVLPGQGGVETAAEIRRSETGRQTAVILITGVYRNVRNRFEAYRRSGADACLFKPFPLCDLLNSVEKALRKRKHAGGDARCPVTPAFSGSDAAMISEPDGGQQADEPGRAEFQQGRRLFRAGLFRAARQCFASAAAVKKDPAYYFYLACATESVCEKDWVKDAMAGYRASLALNPYHAASYFRLGRLYHLQARNQKAEENYRLALTLKPDYNEAARALKKLLGASVKKKKRKNFFP